MRYPPNFLDEIRARLSVSQVVGRKVALKTRRARVQGPLSLQDGEDAVLHRQRPEGLLPLLRLRRARRHLHVPDEDRRACRFPRRSSGWPTKPACRCPSSARATKPREDERERLYRIVEMSAAFFEAALMTGPGAEARRYLEKRGLTRETIAAFRLGYAPNDRVGAAHAPGERRLQGRGDDRVGHADRR